MMEYVYKSIKKIILAMMIFIILLSFAHNANAINISESSQYISFDDGIVGSVVAAKAGQNASFVGSPTQIIGVVGNGYNFSNSSGLNTTINLRNIINDSYAINFWIKNTRNNTGLDFIFSYVDAGGYYSPALYMGSGKFVFNLDSQSPSGNLVFEFANNTLSNGSWHMVTITTGGGGYDCDHMNVYIDAIKANIVCVTDTISTYDSTHMVRSPWFGNRNSMGSTSNGFYGGLDELSIWNYNLTSDNVTDLFNFNFGISALSTINISFIAPTYANNSVITNNFTIINLSSNISLTNCTLNFNNTLYNMTNQTGTTWFYNVTQLNNTQYTYYATCTDGITSNRTGNYYIIVNAIKNNISYTDNPQTNELFLNSEPIINIFTITGDLSNVLYAEVTIYDDGDNLINSTQFSTASINWSNFLDPTYTAKYYVNATLYTIYGNISLAPILFWVVNITNVSVLQPLDASYTIDNSSEHLFNLTFTTSTADSGFGTGNLFYDFYLCNEFNMCFILAGNLSDNGFNVSYDYSIPYSSLNISTSSNYHMEIYSVEHDNDDTLNKYLRSFTRGDTAFSFCINNWVQQNSSCIMNSQVVYYTDSNSCSIEYNKPSNFSQGCISPVTNAICDEDSTNFSCIFTFIDFIFIILIALGLYLPFYMNKKEWLSIYAVVSIIMFLYTIFIIGRLEVIYSDNTFIVYALKIVLQVICAIIFIVGLFSFTKFLFPTGEKK